MQTCIWPSGFHCHSLSLASVKSRLVLPFWYRLTRVVPEKRSVKWVCVCVSFNSVVNLHLKNMMRVFSFLVAMLCVVRSTMIQLGMSLSEGDIHAMMRSVGVGPHGKISYPGIGCIYSTLMLVKFHLCSTK